MYILVNIKTWTLHGETFDTYEDAYNMWEYTYGKCSDYVIACLMSMDFYD